MKKAILCNKCGKRIISLKKLSTAFYYFKIKPYHDNCYNFYYPFEWRPPSQFFGTTYSFTSGIATFTAVFTGIFGVGVLVSIINGIINDGIIINLSELYIFILSLMLFFYIPLARIYSFFKYEKQLK